MPIIKNLKSSTLSNPDKWLTNLFGGGQSYTGKKINEDTAMTYTAVLAAVRIISETIASLPLVLYERQEPRGKKRAMGQSLYNVLHSKANSEMTAFTFRETMGYHLATRGNFYADIEMDNAGRVVGLWPLIPDSTWPERKPDGSLVYKSILPDGTQAVLPYDRVLHIPGLSFDGLIGHNPIHLLREAIGMGLSAEEYGARFFGNGARPGGVLEHPQQLSDKAFDQLRESWNDMHQGLSNQHRIAILEEGMNYKQIGIPPEDAQFLETRKFQVNEIARAFRVPPHMLGDLERATFSNVEQQSIDFVVHTMRPWFVRIEQAINLKLINKETQFCEFLIDGLLRGDTKSRYEAYAIGKQNGWLSTNDIKEKENENPIKGGDKYYAPLNMVPIDQAENVNPDNSNNTDPNNSPDNKREKRTLETRQMKVVERRMAQTNSYEPVFHQAIERILKREEADVMRQVKKQYRDHETFNMWLSDFYSRHEEYIQEILGPIYRMVANQMYSSAAEEINSLQDLPPEMQDFLTSYLETFMRRHNGTSVNDIRAALEKAKSEESSIEESLQGMFDGWKDERLKSEAHEENVRSSNAFVVQSYTYLHVKTMRWVADSKPCPYCRALDGQIVGVQNSFLRAGDELAPEGADPLIPDNKISHAPLHRACGCTVAAESF